MAKLSEWAKQWLEDGNCVERVVALSRLCMRRC